MNLKPPEAEPQTDRSSAGGRNSRRLWDDELLSDPHGRDDKAERVREMFDRIAPTYQRVNTVASAGRDRFWRRETVRLANVKPADRVLDIACGTGDLTDLFARITTERVVGLDFAREMLARSKGTSCDSAGWCQGDAMSLPFGNGSFDITSCAFGIRNFQDVRRGAREMFRVLRPGGRAMILEFAMPTNPLLRNLYLFYFTKIMPRIATRISRDKSGAYDYLPSSVRCFLSPGEMKDLLVRVGFESVEITLRTFGIVYVARAVKATDSGSSTGEQPPARVGAG